MKIELVSGLGIDLWNTKFSLSLNAALHFKLTDSPSQLFDFTFSKHPASQPYIQYGHVLTQTKIGETESCAP